MTCTAEMHPIAYGKALVVSAFAVIAGMQSTMTAVPR